MSVSPSPDPVWLARAKCAHCDGAGRVTDPDALCGCVLRRVCRICLDRFHIAGDYWTPRTWRRSSLNAEYRVDFLLAIRRGLPAKDWRVFDVRYVQELEPTAAAAKLGLNRGDFFHAAYRAEQLAGKALLASGIYPPDRYFAGVNNMTLSARLVDPDAVMHLPMVKQIAQFFPDDWGGPVAGYQKPGYERGGFGLGPWPVRPPVRYPRAA